MSTTTSTTTTTPNDPLLPHPNPTLPYWRASTQLHPLDAHRTTPTLPTHVDTLIIGAGIAGVAVAYHLATSPNPPPSTLLLDARQLSSGATGRNGGHVKIKPSTLFAFAAQHSAAKAGELAAFVRAHVGAIKEVCEREGTAAAEGKTLGEYCEFETRRSYDVYMDGAEAEKAGEAWRECVGRGEGWTKEVDFVGEEFAERVTAVRGARAAFGSPACSLWPYRFVGGLLEVAVGRGVGVQMETPVLGVEETGEGGTVVRTARGSVEARKVVFATNAYTAELLPAYRGVITPVKGTAAHLAAGEGSEPVYPHLSNTYNLEYGRGRVDYLNPRPDGGIVVGGGNWLFAEQRELWYNTVDDSTLLEPVMKAKYFEGYMQRNFRGWDGSGAEAERVWTGIMGATPDGMPHVGKIPGTMNQWILAGFNGGGMTLAFLSAKGIARMVADDVPFEEAGAGIPAFLKTTEERLGKRS